MIKLTARQQQVLNLIKSALEETGFPPTRAEIAKELGFKSPNAAEEHLKALARKGAIDIMPGASRGIRILGSEQEGLPIVGRVAAGEPILAQEHIEEKSPSNALKRIVTRSSCIPKMNITARLSSTCASKSFISKVCMSALFVAITNRTSQPDTTG